ncbi:DUF7341 domain-containing protein [Nocardia brasiliensis]|uniref:DUF7341 domain-containing protein n=1 Tax=Nocardia brasiliensis TaxID=37326 RepID=UPI0024566A61|nr:hypothetical protein [Nocardia brasiliensis]
MAAAFGDAVHDLIGLRPSTIERDDFTQEPVVLDSLYTELYEARYGEQRGPGDRRPTPGSRPPGWTDAISLIDRIDRTVAIWWPITPDDQHSRPATIRRLYALLDYQWRPQDVGTLKRMTNTVEGWVVRARNLLPTEETHTWELRAPCPACGATTTQVDDGTGELVRRYALQADKSSASCSECETSWAPEQYRFLAAVIGAALPTGVLE